MRLHWPASPPCVAGSQVPPPILVPDLSPTAAPELAAWPLAAAGAELVRINLSEQTDMMDLLGADLPVAGGAPGEFAWCAGEQRGRGEARRDGASGGALGGCLFGCTVQQGLWSPRGSTGWNLLSALPAVRRADGPLLAAVKSGAWVLLDELNLAGQTVLEGLNAVLDHRTEVGALPRQTCLQCSLP